MLASLARASIEGALLVAVVWVLTRFLRLSPGVRTIVWWSVAARFVVALAWPYPLNIPILPAETELTTALAVRSVSPAGPAPGVPIPAGPSSSHVVADSAVDWAGVALIAWIAGLALLAIVGVWRWRQTVWMRRESTPASEHLQAVTASLSSNLGLKREPEVRLSDRVDTPLVAGVLRPVVLLPAHGFDRLDADQQRMVICHELVHVKRADLWLGCVPALAERLFFFHPFARVASREYALWREAACDAAVIEALDVPPQEYGRLLMDLGVARPRVGLAAAGASWSFLNLKRRIAMLHDVPRRSRISRLAGAAAVALSLAAIVPMQLVARGTRPTDPVEPAATAGEMAGIALHAEISAQAGKPQTVQPAFDYVLLLEDNGSVTTSGSSADVERARRLKRPGEPMVWVRQNGREHVIRDPETLRRIREAWSEIHHPMVEFDSKIAQHDELIEHAEMAAKHGLEKAHEALTIKEAMADSRWLELSALKELSQFEKLSEFKELNEFHKLAELKEWHALKESAPQIEHEQLEKMSRLVKKELQEQMESLREQLEKVTQELRELKDPTLNFKFQEFDVKVPFAEFKEPFEHMSKEFESHFKAMTDYGHKAEASMRALIQDALSRGLAETAR